MVQNAIMNKVTETITIEDSMLLCVLHSLFELLLLAIEGSEALLESVLTLV